MKKKIQIEYMKIEDLTPAPYNPRIISAEDQKNLEAVLAEYGFVENIVWNETTGNVIGGNQRLKAALVLGLKEVPVVKVKMTLEREKVLNIALNKISGEWDTPILKDLLQELDTGALDMDMTGFSEQEIEDLMAQFSPIDESEVPRLDEIKMVECPKCRYEFTP